MTLLPPLLQSLRIASVATIRAAVIAVPTAYFLSRRAFPGKSILEALLTLPLVFPPTVVGYFLLVLLGHNGLLSRPIGYFLTVLLGRPTVFSILWTWYGAAIAAGVVAFPLLLLPARAAFAAVDRELEDASRLMGASRLQIFWHISLPLALPGIGSGVLLAFARALGEFGATVMVLSIRDSTQTLPIYVYEQFEEFSPTRLVPAVVLLSAVTLAIMLLYNRLPLNRRP